jgi:hypothetical protein
MRIYCSLAQKNRPKTACDEKYVGGTAGDEVNFSSEVVMLIPVWALIGIAVFVLCLVGSAQNRMEEEGASRPRNGDYENFPVLPEVPYRK